MRADHLAEIYAHAREAFPHECCGYIADAVVRCTNVAHSAHEFAIDGAELFAFARTFSTATPARVVYHSHPNGRAYFSATDQRVAAIDGLPAYPVDHVVIGVTADGVTEAARFAWVGGAYAEVERW